MARLITGPYFFNLQFIKVKHLFFIALLLPAMCFAQRYEQFTELGPDLKTDMKGLRYFDKRYYEKSPGYYMPITEEVTQYLQISSTEVIINNQRYWVRNDTASVLIMMRDTTGTGAISVVPGHRVTRQVSYFAPAGITMYEPFGPLRLYDSAYRRVPYTRVLEVQAQMLTPALPRFNWKNGNIEIINKNRVPAGAAKPNKKSK